MVQYLMAQMSARRDEEGQGLVEYALIIVLVSIAAFAALGLLGDQVIAVFGDITGKLTP